MLEADQRAVDVTPAGHPERGLMLANLSAGRVAAPELAAEWETLGAELDTATAGPGEMPSEEAVPVPDPDHRHGLAGRWQSLVSRIRATAGFERFLEPPALADLLPAATSGAVVTIKVSDLRCDALVLTADRVRVVPLPDLDTEKLDTQVHTFLAALDMVGMGDLTESLAAQAALRRTLGWLWDVLAAPVLDELGHTMTPAAGSPWPRVWWSPTGPLNFLPLHAPGRYQDHNGYAVLDRVVSSYAPTIRALLHARSRPVAAQRRLLSVAMSQTPGQAPLPATLTETEVLVGRLGGERPLVDAAATHGNVMSALASASWVHLACHAHSDPTNPDTTAAGVAEGFYTHLINGTSPADALHTVIRGMRDEQPQAPSQWAAYVHAGP